MKWLSLISIFLGALLFGCQPSQKIGSGDSMHEAQSSQVKVEDDFSDLKEKDESCDTEEDLEKKIEEQVKKKEAFKLQGGDGGCDANAL